jgi:hypothetical protein
MKAAVNSKTLELAGSTYSTKLDLGDPLLKCNSRDKASLCDQIRQHMKTKQHSPAEAFCPWKIARP